MCWMVVSKAENKINIENMDKAQKHNEDGYGVAWYENGFVNTYKTFDYPQFKRMVVALENKTIVVHLRYATKGDKSYSNIHPFDTPTGVMFHNGTMHRVEKDSKKSDSQMLANLLSECSYESIKDVLPLVNTFVDDYINRLVFFEDSGEVVTVNEGLGITDSNGDWYSNDYHLKDKDWSRRGKYVPKATTPSKTIIKPSELTKVFVYGTLKKGGRNYDILKSSIFLGKAKTKLKWSMIGDGYSFPYVLEKDHDKGHNVVGEVYAVDSKVLKRLDSLEGVPVHYKKEIIDVVYTSDFTVDTNVTMYTMTNISDHSRQQEYIEEWAC